MIEIQNVSKRYGNKYAVKNATFTIQKGEILGFLGRNGAGKSTTMNIVTGYISASEGKVLVDGHDILEEPREVKRRIGYLPEIPPLYMDMTVEEYLRFVCAIKDVSMKNVRGHLNDICELVSIQDMRKRLIKNLSKGYKQRVGMAQALVGNPEVVIMDEPTVGLDPKQIIEIRKLIKQLGEDHTVVLSSHILHEVADVCERVVIINKGEIVAQDTLEHLTDPRHQRNLPNDDSCGRAGARSSKRHPSAGRHPLYRGHGQQGAGYRGFPGGIRPQYRYPQAHVQRHGQAGLSAADGQTHGHRAGGHLPAADQR